MRTLKNVAVLLSLFVILQTPQASAEFLEEVYKDEIVYAHQFKQCIQASQFHEANALQDDVLLKGNDATKQVAQRLKGQYLPNGLPPVPAEEMLQKIGPLFPLDERIRLARKCVKLYPKCEYSHRALCLAYWMNQQDIEAEKEGLIAVSLSPSNPLILQALGGVYIYSGQKRKARNVFEKVRTLDPKNPLALSFFKEMDKTGGKLSNLVVFDRKEFKNIKAGE